MTGFRLGDTVMLSPNSLLWDKSKGPAEIIRLDNLDCIMVKLLITGEKLWTTSRRFG